MIVVPAVGKTLIDYRREFYPDQIKEIEENAEGKISAIRELINTKSQSELDQILESELFSYDKNTGKKKSPETSGFYKNKMSKAVIELLNEEKLGTPMSFNPEWSVATIKQEKKKILSKKVIEILNQGDIKVIGEVPVTPITALIGALNEKVIKVKKSNNKAPIGNPLIIEKMRKEITQYVGEKSPLKKGQSVMDILGEITELGVVEGIVGEVVFKNNKMEVPLKFSMMLTFKSDEDDYYLDIQEMLINYLKEQNEVFNRQIEYMNESSSSIWFKNQLKLTVSFWKDTFLKGGDITQARVNAFRHDLERKLNLDRTKYFLEGIKLENIDLVSYMKKRIKLNLEVLPYMEKNYTQSLAINQKLKQLSEKQVNFLLDMMLQLRKTDLISDIEITGTEGDETTLTRKIYDKIAQIEHDLKGLDISDRAQRNTLVNLKREMDTDYYYYKIMGDQLYRLEKNLRTDKSIQEIQQQRIKNL